MSDLAKKARAAMKSKAERLGKDRPTQKVDSSTWSPPELLNADVKTGLRPVSRRAYKKGGKVTGEACVMRADRKQRKAGGATGTEIANAKINRNVKSANEEREGKKHIGGMKTGGRAGKAGGGSSNPARDALRRAVSKGKPIDWDKIAPAPYALAVRNQEAKESKQPLMPTDGKLPNRRAGGRAGKDTGGGTFTKGGKDYRMTPNGPRPLENEGPAQRQPPIPQRPQREPEKGMSGDEAAKFMEGRKSGGRTAKKDGGDLDLQSMAGLRPIWKTKPAISQVADQMKKGGRAKKADGGAEAFGPGVAGAAKMMKKSGVAGVPGGNSLYGSGFTRVGAGKLSPAGAAMPMSRMKKGGVAERHEDEAADKALIRKMVKAEARKGRATGGNVFSGSSYPGKIPGVVPGGRTAKAAGGKAKGKGKTNINIVIAAGKPAQQGDMAGQPPGGIPTDNRGPGGIPVPVSQPPGGAAGMPGGGMPIPMPIPMPAGGPPAPAGGMPAGRKAGGRVTKIAKSYKDMEAGAGGGEGRLQKTDIAKTGKGAPTFKRGGKVYRSYKDMDAGAGSGLGRLEKTEIQSRK